MASFRAHLLSEVRTRDDLETMARRLNDDVHRDTAINQFITFFYCELFSDTSELRYVNAGHNPPLLIDRKGKFRPLESSGFALGMFPNTDFTAHTLHLDPGDILVLFTDGITETRNPKNADFEEKGLIASVKKNAKQPATEILGCG